MAGTKHHSICTPTYIKQTFFCVYVAQGQRRDKSGQRIVFSGAEVKRMQHCEAGRVGLLVPGLQPQPRRVDDPSARLWTSPSFYQGVCLEGRIRYLMWARGKRASSLETMIIDFPVIHKEILGLIKYIV